MYSFLGLSRLHLLVLSKSNHQNSIQEGYQRLRLALLGLMFACLISNCAAQWTLSYRDLGAQFADAAFPSDMMGYVAAVDTAGACVLRTTDGGQTWDRKGIPGWGFVNKLAMVDSLVGYAIKGGVPVQILKTMDGFQTWTMHNLDTSFVVEAFELLTDSSGLYLNNGGRLRSFKQHGATYSYLADSLQGGQNLQMVTALGGYWDTGLGLMRTVNGGLNWSMANPNLGFGCVNFRFYDTNKGYFSDATQIYKTINGGTTFVPQYAFPGVYSFATHGLQACIAANDTGNIALTTDGGMTWQYETTGINWLAAEPYEVAMTPSGDCFIYCGVCGEIRKRPDAVTGVDAGSEGVGVSIFPNPASNEFRLGTSSPIDCGLIVSLHDVCGRRISEHRLQQLGGAVTFDLKGYAAGTYLVEVVTELGQRQAFRLVVQ